MCGKTKVSENCNSNKTHPTQQKFNKFRRFKNNEFPFHKVHAEIAAIEGIRHIDVDWRKVTLFIYREYKDGNPALARPCPACMHLIREKGIREVVYTAETPSGYKIEKY